MFFRVYKNRKEEIYPDNQATAILSTKRHKRLYNDQDFKRAAISGGE